MNWQTFHYQTPPPWPANRYTPFYLNWLPKNLEDILPASGVNYQIFDTLVHVTSFENASEIFRWGFKPKVVLDSSVVSSSLTNLDGTPVVPRSSHPMKDLEVVWYGQTTFQDVLDKYHCYEKYGNVAFSMKTLFGYEGILRDGLKIYFIEVIEYKTQAACRFLVTTRDYPELRRYNPTAENGGPFFYNNRTREFYFLTKIKSRRNGRVLKNTVEIMKDRTSDRNIQRWCDDNHFISFTHCQWPKPFVSTLGCCARCRFPNGYVPSHKLNSGGRGIVPLLSAAQFFV